MSLAEFNLASLFLLVSLLDALIDNFKQSSAFCESCHQMNEHFVWPSGFINWLLVCLEFFESHFDCLKLTFDLLDAL